MQVNDQQVTFNVLDVMKRCNEVENCNFVNVVDFAVTEMLNSCYSKEEINVVIFEELEDEDPKTVNMAWLGEQQPVGTDRHFESLNLSNREIKPSIPSIESTPVLELKTLPSHLKYAYLCDNNTLP